jgi:hypothetical protein
MAQCSATVCNYLHFSGQQPRGLSLSNAGNQAYMRLPTSHQTFHLAMQDVMMISNTGLDAYMHLTFGKEFYANTGTH